MFHSLRVPDAKSGLPPLSALGRWRNDENGAIVVIFALALVPIVAVMGAAVDYSRAANLSTRAQGAIDAATLAGVKGATPAERVTIANQVFSSYALSGKLTSLTPTFVNNADGSFSGSVSGRMPTSMMSIMNIVNVEIAAKATATIPPVVSTPASLNFTADSASGWFYKEVKLWVHYPGDATDTNLATFVYQPVNLVTGPGSVSGPMGTPIALGSNFDKIYMTMLVGPDGCGPTQTPKYAAGLADQDMSHRLNYQCVALRSGRTKTVPPYTMSSIDPATSNHLFVDGVQAPLGKIFSITDLAKCNTSVSQAWEDTEAYTPGSGAWEWQDFRFTVTGGACVTNTALRAGTGPRLSR